jgi:formylglycine-generating enzyme required for sulfatase activity
MVALGCSPATPAPVGEVVLTVDTDAPVPTLASRLRVDLFDSSGTWFASRDFGLPDPSDWPTSLAVSAPDGGGTATVTVRLRAYPDGQVRDYLGERFQDWPDPTGDPSYIIPTPVLPAGATPRLYEGSQDVTPATEPQPLVAIDRLLRVTVVPGVVQGGAVVMRGACFATMADVAGDATCVDTEATRVPDADLPLSTPPPPAPASVAGTFGASACTATPRAGTTASDGTLMHDAEVCVPGGAFVFGNAATPSSSADLVSSAPPRVAVVPSFRVDMYELTIARYRAVLRAGYTGAKVVLANDLPIPMSAASASAETQPFCTYSTQPMGRETMPLNCMTWSTARGVCQFLGGDLPTEAQWEYVSAQAGRATKTLYPWDDATPTCAQATFARGDDLVTNLPDMCTPLGFGPQPVGSSMDLSADLGVSDLAGGVTEWMLDAAESLASRCWMSAPLEAPFCHFAKPSSYSTRGASWITPFAAPVTLLVTSRSRGLAADNAVTTATGFRCARDGGGP